MLNPDVTQKYAELSLNLIEARTLCCTAPLDYEFE